MQLTEYICWFSVKRPETHGVWGCESYMSMDEWICESVWECKRWFLCGLGVAYGGGGGGGSGETVSVDK